MAVSTVNAKSLPRLLGVLSHFHHNVPGAGRVRVEQCHAGGVETCGYERLHVATSRTIGPSSRRFVLAEQAEDALDARVTQVRNPFLDVRGRFRGRGAPYSLIATARGGSQIVFGPLSRQRVERWIEVFEVIRNTVVATSGTAISTEDTGSACRSSSAQISIDDEASSL